MITAVLCCTICCGCKNTDVIKEILYSPNNQLIETDSHLMNNSSENEEEDPDIYAVDHGEDSQQIQDSMDNLAPEGEDDSNKDAADMRQSDDVDRDTSNNEPQTASNSPNTQNNNTQTGTVPTGDGDAAETQTSAGTTPAESIEPETTQGGSKDNPEQGSEGGESYEPEAKSRTPKADPTDPYQVIDANGQVIDVPNNVNKVTAVGEAAVMVEMLGGPVHLYATSESVTTNALDNLLFSDIGNGNVRAWWSGTGTSSISDSNFELLLDAALDESSGLEVCFIIDGQSTFSAEQLNRLNELNIPVVTLKKMNTPQNLMDNAEIVAQVLGNWTSEGGKDAEAVAANYINWVKNISHTSGAFKNIFFSDCVSTIYIADEEYTAAGTNANGRYTLLVDHWDDSANVTIYGTGGVVQYSATEGIGAATGGYIMSPVSYYLSVGGVVNAAAAQAAIYGGAKYTYGWYVNQWRQAQLLFNITGSYDDYNEGNEHLSRPVLSMVCYDKYYGLTYSLGSDVYNTVIAGSSYIAEHLQENKYLNDYAWNLPSGEEMLPSIEGSYSIVVNPYGAGSWISGSVESPLESYWAAAQFQTGSITMEEAKQQVIDFYTTFYGCSSDVARSVVDDVMAGSYVPACCEK